MRTSFVHWLYFGQALASRHPLFFQWVIRERHREGEESTFAWVVQREVKYFSASCACVGECNEVRFKGTDAAHRDTEKGVQRSPVQGDWISVRYLAQIPLSSLYNTFNIGDTMRWYEGAPSPPSLSHAQGPTR